MLARLLLAAQNGELDGVQAIGGQGLGGEGGTVVVDENCTVSLCAQHTLGTSTLCGQC